VVTLLVAQVVAAVEASGLPLSSYPLVTSAKQCVPKYRPPLGVHFQATVPIGSTVGPASTEFEVVSVNVKPITQSASVPFAGHVGGDVNP
jgi:hypothetical protein